MTREEILNTPEIVNFMIDKSIMVDSKMKLHKRLDELCKLAIKALDQEPCDDCISRQAAKRTLEDRFIELQKRHDDKRYETNYCLNTILELPPVTRLPKTGHWEQYGNSWEDKFKCSECGIEQPKILCGEQIIGHWSDYCPNCGAQMFDPQESEE